MQTTFDKPEERLAAPGHSSAFYADGGHSRRDASGSRIQLRLGTRTDREAVNLVVDAAVMTWNLPDRVKRLSLPTYRYTDLDLDHLDLILAVGVDGCVVGVAAIEPADPGDLPHGSDGLLLHGLYVLPAVQGEGIGRLLVGAVEAKAGEGAWTGLLVKAHASAAGFFDSLGFEPLAVCDPARDYPHRFWKPRFRFRSFDRSR